MTGLELYQQINKTLSIIIWPITLLVLFLIFKKKIENLINQFTNLEGSFGNFSFKLTAQKVMENALKDALELEKQGKSEEAQHVVKSAGDLAADLFNLSEADIKYLIELSNGVKPKRRWGSIHLVNAGLVELDGGNLTETGKHIVEKYLKV